MRLRSLGVAIIGVLVVFGGILVSDAMGLWQSESTKTPAKFSDGAYEGLPDPGDIRGSYTFQDVENAFDIKAELIAEAFALTTDSPDSIQAKNLEEIYGEIREGVEIGTGSLRLFVSLYTGLPYESDDYLLESAVDVLIREDKWNEEKAAYMVGHILVLDPDFIEINNEDNSLDENQIRSEDPEEEHEQTVAVRGKTSVKDLMDYGISLEAIEEVLGVSVDNENMLVRDICSQNSLNFSEVKEIFNEMLGVD